MQIVATTVSRGAGIVSWRYPPPCDCDDMTSADPASRTCHASRFLAPVDGGGPTGCRSLRRVPCPAASGSNRRSVAAWVSFAAQS